MTLRISTQSFLFLTLYGHIKTAEQRTIIQQYGDRYTGRLWVGCYIWYSEDGPGRAAALSSPSSNRCPKCNSLPINGQCANFILFDVALLLPPTKEVVNAFARVCLSVSQSVCQSVCLLARLLKNACTDLDEMLRVNRGRNMDELINF